MEAPLWLHTAVGGEAMKASGPAEWDQVSCMTCGARDFEVTRPGWAEGLRDWLRFGGPWRPTKRACRRCGTVSSAGSVGALVPYRRGWWSVPVELFRILRRRRTRVPVPATYLVAVVAGALLGVAAQLVLGWPWWLVAAGVVAAVWLFFFSTAFWGGGGSSRPLATEVLRVVSPGRAAPAWWPGGELVQGAAATGHHRAQLGSRRAAGRGGTAAAGRGQDLPRRGSGAGRAVGEPAGPGR